MISWLISKTLTFDLAVGDGGRRLPRRRQSPELMQHSLVQAEVNMAVEYGEVISVLGHLTYRAGQGRAFDVT